MLNRYLSVDMKNFDFSQLYKLEEFFKWCMIIPYEYPTMFNIEYDIFFSKKKVHIVYGDFITFVIYDTSCLVFKMANSLDIFVGNSGLVLILNHAVIWV